MRISDWSSDVCSSDLIGVSVVEALYDAGARVVTTARTVPGQRSLYRGGPDERGRSPRGLRSTRLANRRRGAPERTRTRSEGRRGGKECVSTGRSRWAPYH